MSTIPMVCPRDYTLRTTMGHTIRFKAGEPQPVPEQAYAEALAKNIVPAKRPDADDMAGKVQAQITGTLRDALIYKAVHSLVTRNNSEDFTGGGVPKAASVSPEVGFSLSQGEVGKYWGNYRSIMANNEPLPVHPKTELIEELQLCTTRKMLEEFCADHTIVIKDAKGKSVKEVKERVMHAVISEQVAPPVED